MNKKLKANITRPLNAVLNKHQVVPPQNLFERALKVKAA